MMPSERAIHAIGEMIYNKSRSLSAEEKEPQYDADRSDTEIKTLRNDIRRLRQMRNELEEIAAGCLGIS